jgi:hypothetical protein
MCVAKRKKSLERFFQKCVLSALPGLYGTGAYDDEAIARMTEDTAKSEENRKQQEDLNKTLAEISKSSVPPTKIPAESANTKKNGTQVDDPTARQRREREVKKKRETEDNKEKTQRPDGGKTTTPNIPDQPIPPGTISFEDPPLYRTYQEALALARAFCGGPESGISSYIDDLRTCFCTAVKCPPPPDIEIKIPQRKNDDTDKPEENGKPLPTNVDSFEITKGQYGLPIEIHYGNTVTGGNIIWASFTHTYTETETFVIDKLIFDAYVLDEYKQAFSFALSLGESNARLEVERVFFDEQLVYERASNTGNEVLGRYIGDAVHKTERMSLHTHRDALPVPMRVEGVGYRDLAFLFFDSIPREVFDTFPRIRVELSQDADTAPSSTPIIITETVSRFIPTNAARVVAVVEKDDEFHLVSETVTNVRNVVSPWQNFYDGDEAVISKTGRHYLTGERIAVLPTASDAIMPLRNNMRLTYTNATGDVEEAYVLVSGSVVSFVSNTGAVIASHTLAGTVLATTKAAYKDQFGYLNVAFFAATATSMTRIIARTTDPSALKNLQQRANFTLSLTHSVANMNALANGLILTSVSGISFVGFEGEELQKLSDAGPDDDFRVVGQPFNVLIHFDGQVRRYNGLAKTFTPVLSVSYAGPQAFGSARLWLTDRVVSVKRSNGYVALSAIYADLLSRFAASHVTETTEMPLIYGFKLSSVEEIDAVARVITAFRNLAALPALNNNFISFEDTIKLQAEFSDAVVGLRLLNIDGTTVEFYPLNAAQNTIVGLPAYVTAEEGKNLLAFYNQRRTVEATIQTIFTAPKYLAFNPPDVLETSLGGNLVNVLTADTRELILENSSPYQDIEDDITLTGIYPVYFDVLPAYAPDGSNDLENVTGYVGYSGAETEARLFVYARDGLNASGVTTKPVKTGYLVSDDSINIPDQFSVQHYDTDSMVINFSDVSDFVNYPRDNMNAAINLVDDDTNTICIGREWIRFAHYEPTLNADEYIISGLRRGLFNSEMFTAHAPGDRVVQYDINALAPVTIQKSSLGQSVLVRAFDDADENAPATEMYAPITKFTSYLPPTYADKLVRVSGGYRLEPIHRQKLPVYYGTGLTFYGVNQVPYSTYLFAVLEDATVIDNAMFNRLVSAAQSGATQTTEFLAINTALSRFIRLDDSWGSRRVVWKAYTPNFDVYGHWTVAYANFTLSDYPVKCETVFIEQV